MAKFIDPFTDTGFKIVFGEEDILRQFLNALFEKDPGFNQIERVEYRPNERTREWTEGKSIVYDIFCETSTGHKFIVEMQKHPQEYFLSRAVYYVSRAIADQGYKGRQEPEKKSSDTGHKTADPLLSETVDSATGGEGGYWDYNVVPVVGVFFSNFRIPGLQREKFVTMGALMDIEDKEPIGSYMRYVFIQIPVFRKEAEECNDKFTQWMYNLTHMKSMEAMQFTSHQEIFNRLARVGNLATLSPAERSMYEYDLKKARDYHAELAYARKLAKQEGFASGRAEGLAKGKAEGLAKGKAEGLAQGKAEGRAEGRAEGVEAGKLAIARNMIKSGVPLAEIALWTGIPLEQLESMT